MSPHQNMPLTDEQARDPKVLEAFNKRPKAKAKPPKAKAKKPKPPGEEPHGELKVYADPPPGTPARAKMYPDASEEGARREGPPPPKPPSHA